MTWICWVCSAQEFKPGFKPLLKPSFAAAQPLWPGNSNLLRSFPESHFPKPWERGLSPFLSPVHATLPLFHGVWTEPGSCNQCQVSLWELCRALGLVLSCRGLGFLPGGSDTFPAFQWDNEVCPALLQVLNPTWGAALRRSRAAFQGFSMCCPQL